MTSDNPALNLNVFRRRVEWPHPAVCRLKMYRGDGSDEFKEFWFEMERAKSRYRPSQTINFYVDPGEGHDDFLMSLALLVKAANQYSPREAKGSIPNRQRSFSPGGSR